MTKFSLRPAYPKDHVSRLSVLNVGPIPKVMTVLAVVATLTVVGTAAFLIYVPWIQTVSGNGSIAALDPTDREQAISALVPGRIAEWFVREGSRVKAGDPIARIVDNDPKLVDRLMTQLSVTKERMNTAIAARDTARLDANRKQELFQQGLVSRLEMEQAQIRLNEFDVRVQSATEDLNRAEVALNREGSQMVLAPRDGIITRVTASGTATFVRAGDRLALFAPANVDRVVEIYLDGLDAALVEPGREVRLQFEGWPVIQFSGWPSVAVGTFEGTVAYVDPLASVDGLFRVIVRDTNKETPWPPASLLRLGTGVRGWVLLEEVSVGYELWRQVNNFPPEFAPGTLPESGE